MPRRLRVQVGNLADPLVPLAARRLIVGVLGVAMVAGPTVACSTSDESAPVTPVTPVTVTVTATAPSTTGSAASTSIAVGGAGLAAKLTAWVNAASQPVGVSVVATGGSLGEAANAGDQTTHVAWSTIKVPVAIAAEQANGPASAATAAIVNSDNGAAEQLWASLGSASSAAAAVTAVLREGGDPTTAVPATRLRDGFTIFGQTRWPLPNAATFSANLPCIADSDTVVSLMGQVAGNQQWGLEVVPIGGAGPKTIAVKGGWGPGQVSGYLVRQIGLITHRDGTSTGVAMSTVGPSLDSGIAALNSVAGPLGRNVAALPRGKCDT